MKRKRTAENSNDNSVKDQKTKSTKKYTLNVSEATPVVLSPGDFQYERVYSVEKSNIQDIGGGSILITLTIGLNFKGIINVSFSDDKFRLEAPELNGPVAPVSFAPVIVDSKSYLEKDVKFEIKNTIKKFSIVIESKAVKKWHFSIE